MSIVNSLLFQAPVHTTWLHLSAVRLDSLDDGSDGHSFDLAVLQGVVLLEGLSIHRLPVRTLPSI